MSDSIAIDEFLRECGFDTPAAMAQARAALEAAGLTRGGKRAIATVKLDRARQVLGARLIRVCAGSCAALPAPDGRVRAVVSQASCEVCRGSNNRRAALTALEALRAHGAAHLLIVGGNDSQVDDIARLLEPGVELRIVDGTSRSHSQKSAVANMGWADVMVIWGPTPLRHAVSDLYTSEPPPHLRVITVARRGIEALCNEIVESYHRSG